MTQWETVNITDDKGVERAALAPEILSASRSTDIPAFYSDWLLYRLQRGYLVRINPFNQRGSYISLDKTKVVVFWSKNPRPLLEGGLLDELDEEKIRYYFQYTLNDYDSRFEPGIPPLDERIASFQRLSERIGRKKMIWRFDPLILTDDITLPALLLKIRGLGDQLKGYTEKLVISFIDIRRYRTVQNKLERSGISGAREFQTTEMVELAAAILDMAEEWGMKVATCAEAVDLKGISHNKCIDDGLMGELFSDDQGFLKRLERYAHKDPGQRKLCGCIVSQDIGQYNTCRHACAYCYANTSIREVENNWAAHQKDPFAETITGDLERSRDV